MLNATQLKAELDKIKSAIDVIEADFDPDEHQRKLIAVLRDAESVKGDLDSLIDDIETLAG